VHSPAFVALVEDAKSRIRETTSAEVQARLDAGEPLVLIDVREESEYAAGHLPGALPIGRGILERDIEDWVGERDQEIVLYCGGGYRSALAADNLQRMGFTNVWSMAGGIRAWRAEGRPL
jgi:rhodanese-related sulfurtransferase